MTTEPVWCHGVGGVSYLDLRIKMGMYQHRSLECQHEDFRGSRWIEQLDGDLLTGRSLINLMLEILKMDVKYSEGVSRILSCKIKDDYHD